MRHAGPRAALLAGLPAALAAASVPVAAFAATSVEVRDAWTTPAERGGGEVPLYMTLVNRAEAPDTLVRVRCPVAWSSEPRVTDRGEGGLADRAVKSIPLPPGAEVGLAPGGPHIALMQLKDKLQSGQSFTCTAGFGSGGTAPVQVTVREAPAEAAR